MDVVLTFGDSLREQIFPDLLKLAEDPATREIAHAKLLKQRITWWPQFFNHAAAKATSVETLRALFQMQADGPNAVTTEGLRAYLQRLQRENLWIESYLVWLNNLRKDQLNAIGNLFNGGFEEEISNLGFDWIVTPASQVVVDTASTYGATGHKALRVVFRGPRIQFQHVHQYLMLDPGAYSLHGRVRPDNLETSEGIQWSIYCVGNTKALAHSERFHGNRSLATFHCPVHRFRPRTAPCRCFASNWQAGPRSITKPRERSGSTTSRSPARKWTDSATKPLIRQRSGRFSRDIKFVVYNLE